MLENRLELSVAVLETDICLTLDKIQCFPMPSLDLGNFLVQPRNLLATVMNFLVDFLGVCFFPYMQGRSVGGNK